MAEAFRQLRSGRARPVAVETPWNVFGMQAEVTPVAPLAPLPAPVPDPAGIGAAAQLIAAATRPLIMVGAGALEAAGPVLELAELLQAPVTAHRSGKGIVYAANYPLAEEDLDAGGLPSVLAPHRQKLFGLTIRPDRLQQIRHERRPDSRYASLPQVQFEIRAALALFERVGIPYLDTTECSIEEIASRIMDRQRLVRRVRL